MSNDAVPFHLLICFSYIEMPWVGLQMWGEDKKKKKKNVHTLYFFENELHTTTPVQLSAVGLCRNAMNLSFTLDRFRHFGSMKKRCFSWREDLCLAEFRVGWGQIHIPVIWWLHRTASKGLPYHILLHLTKIRGIRSSIAPKLDVY